MTSELKVPTHVAIIMDGNGRWAQSRNLPRSAGHKKGVDAVKSSIQFCLEKKIKVLTLFVFSKENWKRPEEEVKHLFSLFMLALKKDIKQLHKHNICLKIIGDRVGFSTSLIEAMDYAENLTSKNTALELNVAINYSGRWDISNAIEKMQKAGDTDFEKYLCLAGIPDPDLLIRTSGVYRLSNFLLWNLAYTELYFTPVLCPDFTAVEFNKAIEFFVSQERRFGLTSAQVQELAP